MKHVIVLQGCDDKTVLILDLSKEEVQTIKRIEKESQKTSTYGCMPILRILNEEECKNFINEECRECGCDCKEEDCCRAIYEYKELLEKIKET